MKLKRKNVIILVLALILILFLVVHVFLKANCFEFIHMGTTYYQVAAVMGAKGKKLDLAYTCYEWYLYDGSHLQVIFDYNGPPLTPDQIANTNLEKYWIVTNVCIYKP